MLVAGRPRQLAAAPCICFVLQLLDASAAEAAWNFCASVTDYDGLRKKVAAIFADKVVEVQRLVAKLQKTQRAAEQALDKCVLTGASWRLHRVWAALVGVAGMRKPAPRDAAEFNTSFNKGPSA